MQRSLVLLTILVMACSQQQSRTNASAARTNSSNVASAAAPPTCRLPVVSWYQPGTQGDVLLPPMGVRAHYVSYPDGAVSTEPADEFTNGGDGFGWRSAGAPVLRGTGPVGYYDSAGKRFVPVPRAQVSPDGRRYVYMDYTQGGLYAFGQIHVVDVGTGRDRTLDLPAAQYQIFDFSADGIYFTYGPYGQSAGLWLLNPDSGSTRQVFQDGYVRAVADGQAWVAVNEQNLHPTAPFPGGEGNPTFPLLNVLLRRDIKSGQVTEWLRRPLDLSYFELLGVYGGAAAVLVYLTNEKDPSWKTGNMPYEVWLVSRPATPEKASAGVGADLLSDPWYRTGREGLGISDSYGIWLGGSAIYLYKSGKGMTKIATFPGFPANGCLKLAS
jgi:hypothetical protein